MYFRLFAFQLLGLTLDRLLYLDADVVCKGDISQLLHLGLNGAVAAVVKDVEPMQEKGGIRGCLILNYLGSTLIPVSFI